MLSVSQKKMGIIKVSLLTLLNCFLAIASAEESVKISLYYESLCQYCIEFIIDQLYPGYQKLGDIITLELLPYGNGLIKQNGTKRYISCMHGTEECYANRLHACSIQNNPTKTWLGFIACTVEDMQPYNNNVAEKCATKFSLPWNKLKACANGEEGKNLTLKYGERTEAEGVVYSPYISYNGVHDITIENKLRANFTKTVCGLFKNPPEVCNTL